MEVEIQQVFLSADRGETWGYDIKKLADSWVFFFWFFFLSWTSWNFTLLEMKYFQIAKKKGLVSERCWNTNNFKIMLYVGK